jgi:hypothetical protein
VKQIHRIFYTLDAKQQIQRTKLNWIYVYISFDICTRANKKENEEMKACIKTAERKKKKWNTLGM